MCINIQSSNLHSAVCHVAAQTRLTAGAWCHHQRTLGYSQVTFHFSQPISRPFTCRHCGIMGWPSHTVYIRADGPFISVWNGGGPFGGREGEQTAFQNGNGENGKMSAVLGGQTTHLIWCLIGCHNMADGLREWLNKPLLPLLQWCVCVCVDSKMLSVSLNITAACHTRRKIK